MKLSPGGSFPPLRSPGAVYARCRIRKAPYTCGAVYAWSHICMKPYTHGAVYAWSHILVAPAHSPCSQLTPLAPWASLGPWNFPGGLESPQLTPLTSSLLPFLPACSPCPLSISRPWDLPKASGSPQLTPSLLSLLPEYPWVPGTSLTPSWLQLPPAHSQLAPNGQWTV